MPQFAYKAVNKEGVEISGEIEVSSESDVRFMLRSQALRPTEIQLVTKSNSDSGGIFGFLKKQSLGDAEVLLFTRQLAILVNSGIPLVQGLEIIESQAVTPKLKIVAQDIRERISKGSFLWESLKAQGGSFEGIYTNMVRAGESSGALDVIFRRLMRYMEDILKLKRLLKSALVYPIAVTSIGAVVITVMMTYVIPKFEEMLKSSGQELPLATQVVISISQFFQHYIGALLVGGIFLAFFTKKYLETEEGTRFFGTLTLRMPIFGSVIQRIQISRLCRTMQTLLASGVTLLDAIDIAKGAVGNVVYTEILMKVKTDVESGKTLSLALAKYDQFPSMLIQMVAVGESSGQLDQMLERVADYYEDEVETSILQMTKMIEPIMLVVLGGMVGGLLIAMYLPIFNMGGSLGS